jgi:hypothetical protein
MQQIQTYIQQNSLKYGVLWLVFVNQDGWWYTDQKQNFQYILDSVTAAKNLGITPGIFSVQEDWGQIVGSNWDDSLASLPLWYENDNGEDSFDDWQSVKFGGWAAPSLKVTGGGQICDVTVGQNWRP